MRMTRPVTTLGTATGCLLSMTAALGLAVCFASPAAAQSSGCGTATLTDVEVVTAWIPQGTVTTVRRKPNRGTKPGDRQMDAYTTPAERQTRRYRVTIRLNDMVYTSESSGDWFWDFDPTRLVINDPIAACVARDTLRLRRPDGKDYTSKIIRVVRDVPNELAHTGSGR